MALIYKIVLIDDDATVRSDLFGLGNSIGFEVFPFDNLEDGIEKLKQDTTINGLVLDAECKISKDAKEHLNFLAQAAVRVEELKRSRDRDIFVVVNTAFSGDVVKFFGKSYPINKKEEPHKLFETLKEGIDSLEKSHVRRKYSDSIDSLKSIIGDTSKEGVLVGLLKNMKREDPETIETNLGQVRKVYEALMMKIADEVTIPPNLYEREKIKFLSGKKYYLRDVQQQAAEKIFPEYIHDICIALWGLGSSGSHISGDEIHSTKHTVIGATHLLLDLINWVDIWLDE